MQHGHHAPLVRVDTEGRCAVMLTYANKLVVLPFRKETASEDDQSGTGYVITNWAGLT